MYTPVHMGQLGSTIQCSHLSPVWKTKMCDKGVIIDETQSCLLIFERSEPWKWLPPELQERITKAAYVLRCDECNEERLSCRLKSFYSSDPTKAVIERDYWPSLEPLRHAPLKCYKFYQ